VGWDAQPRDDRGLSWREAWGMLRLQTLFGAGCGLYLAVMDPVLLSWALPLVGGLLLAVPAAVWSSRTSLGQGARRAGLFLTVDETSPSPVLRALQRAMGRRPVNREEVSQANAVGTLSLGTGDPR
jgi:membrane glycosyltransferase